MTSDYSKGEFYKIEPVVDHEEHAIYIGSTTKEYFSQRMTTHRLDYNRWNNKSNQVMSYDLFIKKIWYWKL